MLLHGHGDQPDPLIERAARLVDADTLLIAPFGPVTTTSGAPAWFPSAPGDTGPDLAAALDHLDPLVRELTTPHRVDTPPDELVDGLIGYSQGAATALALAFRAAPEPRWRPAAVATIAGWLPSEPDIDWDFAAATDATRALLIHGADDEVVDAQLGRAASRVLGRSGVDATFDEHPAGHPLTDDELRRALAFVTARH